MIENRKQTAAIVGVIAGLLILTGVVALSGFVLSSGDDPGGDHATAGPDFFGTDNHTNGLDDDDDGDDVDDLDGIEEAEPGDTIISLKHVTEPAGDSYNVSDLDAPETASPGEEIEVSADITNPNNFTTTQRAEYRFEGVVQNRTYLTLEANETERVTFTMDLTERDAAEHIHGIYTFDDGEVGIIDLTDVEPEPEPEPDPEVERTAELTVTDQEGEGDTLTVEHATSNVDFYLQAEYEDETTQSEAFDADEVLHNHTLDLDPPIENDTTVTVSVHASEDDEELISAEIQYTVVEPEPDPEPEPERTAELIVTDQEGEGDTLMVEHATSNVDFYLQAEYNGEVSQSETFEANESLDNYSLALDPPIENDTTVTVSVHASEDDEELISAEIQYTVEEPEPDRTGELIVSDQSGDGETLLVDQATADEEFYVAAAYDGEVTESATFSSDVTLEDLVLELDPPIEADTTVTVTVQATEDDFVLAEQDIEYTIE